MRCQRCPRLVGWREEIAHKKTKRFLDQEYWGRAVPGFGDPRARLLLVGLAPAAHGANRTGRMFTGDRSGDWLYRALHKAGFANQPESEFRGDGLQLVDCYITAACRCAPPQNRPLPQEFANCRPFLKEEFNLLKNIRVIVGLGKIGFDSSLQALQSLGLFEFRKRPQFSHGSILQIHDDLHLIGSFHPSQQNTFTGRLTEEMFDSIFEMANALLGR